MILKLREQAAAMAEEIMRTYYCERDIYAVLSRMAPDATWIGPGEREKIYTLAEMRDYFEQGKDSIPPCVVSNVNLRTVDLGTDTCIVTGSMTIRTKPESRLLLEVDQRVSFTFRWNGQALEVVHLHNSNPYSEMKHEEYFPHQMGAQSYQYLQRLLREKTEVIDMIAGNINGGLKGSNDDDTFSYFYVNEGLPRMLGFTYEEFMKKTGGTAVGAVYPPDLPGALADCARCFAQGPVYSTEYRMEKRDGSLIWVLDSGRKAVDSEGVTRINSIVTDITPLKQALFDLEVERERYRIAMENINDAMCEYDVSKDLFTVYRQRLRDGKRNMETRTFENFSKMVHAGELVHPEDCTLFLDLCLGLSSGPIEFRGRLLVSEGPWRWDQFNCSVIRDSTGAPLRAVGMIKDITEERLSKLHLEEQARRDGLTRLLNQTAVRDAIQSYLAKYSQHQQPCALLMLDLDHFKELNDSKGHLYGNDVLIRTARILEETVGPDSIIGRSGGDEFLVLAKNVAPQDAGRLADTIVGRVNALSAEQQIPISCSVGIAGPMGEEEGFTRLFERADRALYRAKANGRNCWALGRPGDMP